jgi:hypothetical protein
MGVKVSFGGIIKNRHTPIFSTRQILRQCGIHLQKAFKSLFYLIGGLRHVGFETSIKS